MTVTEDEAREKWCPMYRSQPDPDGAGMSNRDGGFEDRPHCIGSECMMWIPVEAGSNIGRCGLAR